ncbi:MAG: DUF4837 family protein [Bacteroidota bacterium]
MYLRVLVLSLAAAAFALLSGCEGTGDLRPFATGPDTEVSVVMDSTHWNGPIGEAIRASLAEYIDTLPAPEPLLDLRHVNLTSPTDFERVKQRKNVVFVAPIADSTNEAQVLRSVLDEEARQAVTSGQVPAVVVPRDSPFRQQQQVIYITGTSPESIIGGIEQNTGDLRYLFAEIIRERLNAEMFEKRRQFNLEDTLLTRHDFAVNVQHDYRIATDTTDFVWLRRILSDTWRSLFVYNEDNFNPNDLTPEWILATRDSLTQRYLQGNVEGAVIIDRPPRRPLVIENIDFLGRYGFETRGLWITGVKTPNGPRVVGGGGPFVNYSFYDEQTGRVYMIDGMVFAPGYEKREFLRQMEVIAYTFRTDAELNQQIQQAD